MLAFFYRSSTDNTNSGNEADEKCDDAGELESIVHWGERPMVLSSENNVNK